MDLITEMFNGIELDDATKQKAKTLLEAHIAEKSNEAIASEAVRLNEEFEKFKTEYQKTLTDKVDTFINESVTKWAESNTTLINESTKVKSAETILTGIKSILAESGFVVPEAGSELETLQEKVKELEVQKTQLQESLDQVEKTQKEKEVKSLYESYTVGMVETQRDRFTLIAESLSHSDLADLKAKLDIIAEAMKEKSTDPEDKEKGKEGEVKDGKKTTDTEPKKMNEGYDAAIMRVLS